MDQVERPLGKIVLGLSGGGYRAAAFHLGVLDVLHAVGLLEDVAAISTVSGGTITGAAYALAAARRQPFGRFYPHFYAQLQERPLHRALASLGAGPRSQRAPTLVAALAEAYDAVFFHGARFGEILDDNPSHLDEIALNATDFAAGLPFRFQYSRHYRVRMGNGRHSIPRQTARDLRLADIVAASSCYPGGFEPIRFPGDFAMPPAAEAAPRGPLSPIAVSLMDGGVADNQGLNSLMAAIGRIDRAPAPQQRVGLIIVSDVDRPADGPLLKLNDPPMRHGLRVRHLTMLAWTLFLVASFTLVGAGWQVYGIATAGQVALGEVAVPLLTVLLSSAVLAGLIKLRRVVRSGLDCLDAILGERPPNVATVLGPLRVRHLVDLMQMRAQSLLVMSSSVFMKSIRDLRYKLLFSGERYRERAAANFIWHLAEKPRRNNADLPQWLEPTEPMRHIAASAARMPTILWFQDAEQLPAIVACGRHTACFNLLRHLVLRYGAQLEGADPKTREAFDRARRLWQQFQTAPLQPAAIPLETPAPVAQPE